MRKWWKGKIKFRLPDYAGEICRTCGDLMHDPSHCHPGSCECGRCKAKRRGRPAAPPAAKPEPRRVIYKQVSYDDAGKYKYGDTLVVGDELYQVASVGTMGATPWGNVKFELVTPPDPKQLTGALQSLVEILRDTTVTVDDDENEVIIDV